MQLLCGMGEGLLRHPEHTVTILALEGPDRCGKTSVFLGLQGRVDATFKPSYSIHPDLFPHMQHVDVYEAAIWQSLYVKQLVIADRFFAVSAQVYAAIHGRPPFALHNMWKREVIVVYFDVPVEELRRRHAATGDPQFDIERYSEVKRLYEVTIRKFKYIRVDGTRKTSELVDEIASLASSLS